jgi:hypothetical protein
MHQAVAAGYDQRMQQSLVEGILENSELSCSPSVESSAMTDSSFLASHSCVAGSLHIVGQIPANAIFSEWFEAVPARAWLQWSFALWRGVWLRGQLETLRLQIECGETSHPEVEFNQCETTLASTSSSAIHQAIANRRNIQTLEFISEVAWSGRVHILSVFIAWEGAVKRSSALRAAVSTPLGKIAIVLCTFSAWVLLADRQQHGKKRKNIFSDSSEIMSQPC